MSGVFEEHSGSLCLHIFHRQHRPVGIGGAAEGTLLMMSFRRMQSVQGRSKCLEFSALLLMPLFLFHLCFFVSVAPPTPEWAQQELGRTAPWNSSVVEKWFPCSNFSGASSNLMESFW